MPSDFTSSASAELVIRQLLKSQGRIELRDVPEDLGTREIYEKISGPYTVIDFAFDEKVWSSYNEEPDLWCRVEVTDVHGWKLSFRDQRTFAELLTEALKADLVGLVIE